MTRSDIEAGMRALRQALAEATAAQTGFFRVDYNSKVSDELAWRGVSLIIDAVDKHRAARKT